MDKELFQKCSCNIGMYKLVEDKMARQELTEERVEDFVRATLHRWDCPVKYDRSMAELDVELMKERMEEPLEQRMARRSSPKRRSSFGWALPKGYRRISAGNRSWTPPRSCGWSCWREQGLHLQSH